MFLRTVLAAFAVSVVASSGVSAQALTCPASIDGDVSSGGQVHDFKYVSFFDGDPAEMADLAPADGENPKVLEQHWNFTRTPGRPINMVCRYHGTDQVVKREVPEDVTQCKLSGLMDGHGEILGSPSLECE